MAQTTITTANFNGYDSIDWNDVKILEKTGDLMYDLGEHASADFWSNVASDGGNIPIGDPLNKE